MDRQLQQVLFRFEEIDRLLGVPEIVADAEQLRTLMKERKALAPLVAAAELLLEKKQQLSELGELLTSRDEELRRMAEEEERELREQLSRAEADVRRLLLPKREHDDRNVIVEIRAGAGGEEAALFAADLYRMYSMYVAGTGFRIEPISQSPTELGGYREISFMIVGEGAYARFRYESGVHRVQRVPRTESQGRIQTSTVTVAVLPEVEDVQVAIHPSDLEIETLKSSGAGGQHINKTESAIRIYHKPSGIVVFCQEERSQFKNRDKAMRMLRAKLYEAEQSKQSEQVASARRHQIGSGDRSEKIRTYNYPQSRVTDHRIGLTLHRLDSLLNGNIEELLDALMTADASERMKAGNYDD